MKGKKGQEFYKIAEMVIALVLLIALVLAVMFLVSGRIPIFGEIWNTVTAGYKDLKLFDNGKGDINNVGAIEKTQEELLESFNNEKDCTKKNNWLTQLNAGEKDKTKITTYKSNLFECYITENNCEEAKKIFDEAKIDNELLKSSKILKLIKCYALKGVGNDAEPIKGLLNQLPEDKKKEGGKLLSEIKSVEQNLKDYQTAVDVVVSSSATQENKGDAKKILIKLKSNLESIKSKNNLQNELLEATKFWLAKIVFGPRECNTGTVIPSNIIFPNIQNPLGHGGEEINSLFLYETIKCYDNSNNKKEVYSNVIKILNEYGGKYEDTKIKPILDLIIKEYGGDKNCKPLGDNDYGCDSYYKELEQNYKNNKLDSYVYKSMRCYFFDVPYDKDDLCNSCSDINSCDEYNDARPCPLDPCGVGTPPGFNGCMDVGGMFFDKCVLFHKN